MLPLVADPVVCNFEMQAEDICQERVEPDIEIVGHNIGVVLDVRPYNPLAGPIIACKIVCKPWEVPLEVVPLYIRIAQG